MSGVLLPPLISNFVLSFHTYKIYQYLAKITTPHATPRPLRSINTSYSTRAAGAPAASRSSASNHARAPGAGREMPEKCMQNDPAASSRLVYSGWRLVHHRS